MSLKFQPLLSGSTKGLANVIDLAPDSQLSISDTYTENKFNNSIASTNLNNSVYLSFLHLNIRSLSRNFDTCLLVLITNLSAFLRPGCKHVNIMLTLMVIILFINLALTEQGVALGYM